MTVALSSLRVVTEGDSSSYVKSMNDVATSSDKATESVGKFTDAQGNQINYLSRTGDALSNASSRFERLQRSLDPAYASQVRLTQAQATLQGALERGVISTERYNELMALAGQRFEDVGRKAGPLGKVFEGISGQLIALSAGAGPVGVALAGLGPVGLAAAAGIGAASLAMGYLKDQAERFGEKASKLHEFAETAGTTAVQMQVLQHAAANVGLAADAVQTSFERFSVQLSELQKGSGNFYSELQRVNPSLVLQLATTKDAAKAWDLLSEAYAKADVRQQALIAHAAFGRGGAGAGRLLSATAEAGGIEGLQGKLSANEIFGDDQLKRVGELEDKIKETKESATDMFASTFSETVLQAQLRSANIIKSIAEYVKDIHDNSSTVGWLLGAKSGTFSMDNARSELAAGLKSGARSTGAGAYYPSSYERPAGAPEGPPQPSAEFQINTARATLAALGSAATAYEQQALKVRELDYALAHNVLTQTEYNRALAGVKLDTVIALEGQRLGLLGELAPVSEIVAQRENQIASAREKGAKFTDDEAKAIAFLTRTQTEGARLQQQITLGVASEAQIRSQLANELRANESKGLYDPRDPLQLAAANVVLGKSFEKMSEQAQLARAPLEQLKKWEIDASNFRLQIDTASVSTLNQMTTSIVDFTTGTKTATQAFQDFGKSVIRILEEMIVKMLLARALSAALGAFGGGGAAPGYNPNSTSGLYHGGGMMDEPSGVRSVHPGAFMNAPRFHSGIGPDEMPAIIRRDEGVFTPGQMRAMGAMGAGGSTQVNVYNQADNSSVKTSKRRQGGIEITDVIISTVGKHMANGGFDGQLRARTGTQVQPRGR